MKPLPCYIDIYIYIYISCACFVAGGLLGAGLKSPEIRTIEIASPPKIVYVERKVPVPYVNNEAQRILAYNQWVYQQREWQQQAINAELEARRINNESARIAGEAARARQTSYGYPCLTHGTYGCRCGY